MLDESLNDVIWHEHSMGVIPDDKLKTGVYFDPYFIMPTPRLPNLWKPEFENWIGNRMKIINDTKFPFAFTGNTSVGENGAWASYSIEPECEVIFECYQIYTEVRGKEIGWNIKYNNKQI